MKCGFQKCATSKHTTKWPREATQQLRASVALAEGPGLIPSTHRSVCNCLDLQFRGSKSFGWTPGAPGVHVGENCILACRENTNTHKAKINTSLGKKIIQVMGTRNANYFYGVLMLRVTGTRSECSESQFAECKVKTKHSLEQRWRKVYCLQEARGAWESFPKKCSPGKAGILFREPMLTYKGISLKVSTSWACSVKKHIAEHAQCKDDSRRKDLGYILEHDSFKVMVQMFERLPWWTGRHWHLLCPSHEDGRQEYLLAHTIFTRKLYLKEKESLLVMAANTVVLFESIVRLNIDVNCILITNSKAHLEGCGRQALEANPQANTKAGKNRTTHQQAEGGVSRSSIHS